MSTEELKAVVRRYYDVYRSGDIAALDHLLDATYVDHNPVPDQAPGIEGVRRKVAEYRASFPDIDFKFEDQIAEADKVVSRITIRGTHASGKPVTIGFIDIVTIVDGRVVAEWGVADSLGLMRQLGMLPPSEEISR
jgi:predicted ester cyclase